MFRIATAFLLLTATAAQADTIGEDFCNVMRVQHLACLNEARVRTGGDYLRKCPRAKVSFEEAFKNFSSQASGDLRSELDHANALWQEISEKPFPQIGETTDAYKSRNQSDIDSVNTECNRLYNLDSN